MLQKFDLGEQKVSLSELLTFGSAHIKPYSRNSKNCECLIWKNGKLKLNEKHPFKEKQKESKNTYSSSTSRVPFPQQTVKRCTKYLMIIGQGLSHFCTSGTTHGQYFLNTRISNSKMSQLGSPLNK